ncbi:hypothetical protein SDC9_211689 [bioreactor metagenome]|uniref:Uncharacterized protein n=1 Tax=bioreactor metagenome TaxID=1076179 RepID=A0A645JKZ0_9ZZZZ
MHGAGAAKGYQNKLPGVDPFSYRQLTDGISHFGVGNFANPFRRFFGSHIQSAGDGIHRSDGGIFIQFHLAAQKTVGIDSP